MQHPEALSSHHACPATRVQHAASVRFRQDVGPPIGEYAFGSASESNQAPSPRSDGRRVASQRATVEATLRDETRARPNVAPEILGTSACERDGLVLDAPQQETWTNLQATTFGHP